MEIKILDRKEEKLVFLLKGIDENVANALRRTVQEVETLAVDEVEFIKNDSALYDEILAHRLGLLPLKTGKTITSRKDCSCRGKGCSKCTIGLKLKAKGPSTVYASDLKGKGLIVHPKIPIVVLSGDQELELNAYAILGTGKEHTKFSPGLVYYKPLVEIIIARDCDLCEECVKACPINILFLEDKKISVRDIEQCSLCEACVEACKKHGNNAIKVTASREDFIFVIESWGQLSAREIFIESGKVLQKNLREIHNIVSKI